MYKILLEKTKSIPGSRVEHNKFCLSVHFRCVDEKVKTIYKTIYVDFIYIYICMFFFSFFLLWFCLIQVYLFCFIFIFQSWAALAEQVRLVLNEYPKLRLTQGRKVQTKFKVQFERRVLYLFIFFNFKFLSKVKKIVTWKVIWTVLFIKNNYCIYFVFN